MIDLVPFQDFFVEKCGLLFENERQKVLTSGLRSRMAARRVAAAAYLDLLMRDEEEFGRLVELVTVNETYFFREPAHLEILAARLVPELLRKGRNGEKIRIVSAGCSTGEEAYSIAIALWESYGSLAATLFDVVAVDIDVGAITRGWAGIYGRGSFRGFGEELLARHFVATANGLYRVKEHVRGLVTFAPVNLRSGLYPGVMEGADVIFYRNVSIYFPAPVQREIFANLARTLSDGGYLLVSATETIHHDIGVLSLVEIDGSFLYRKRPGAGREYRLPAPLPPVGSPSLPRTAPVRGKEKRDPANVGPRSRFAGTAALPEASFERALTLARDKEYGGALGELERLLAADPGSARGHTLKGSILINLNRFVEATAACEAALEADRWWLEGHLLLGVIARFANREDDAYCRFREALYIEPSCWLAHFYLAEIHAARGEAQSARREYELVMKIVGKGERLDAGLTFFPLAFQAEQMVNLCRHNLGKLA